MKKKGMVSLLPNWALKDDVLMGWVVIHRNHTNRLGLMHSKHVKIKNTANNKTITCRIYGPGEHGQYYDYYGSETVEKSIFLDAYYRQHLGITSEDISNNLIHFEITAIKRFGPLKASLRHPSDSVKAGAWLGIISVSLGILSLVFAFLL